MMSLRAEFTGSPGAQAEGGWQTWGQRAKGQTQDGEPRQGRDLVGFNRRDEMPIQGRQGRSNQQCRQERGRGSVRKSKQRIVKERNQSTEQRTHAVSSGLSQANRGPNRVPSWRTPLEPAEDRVWQSRRTDS